MTLCYLYYHAYYDLACNPKVCLYTYNSYCLNYKGLVLPEGQTFPFTYILTIVTPLSFIFKDVSIAKPPKVRSEPIWPPREVSDIQPSG